MGSCMRTIAASQLAIAAACGVSMPLHPLSQVTTSAWACAWTSPCTPPLCHPCCNCLPSGSAKLAVSILQAYVDASGQVAVQQYQSGASWLPLDCTPLLTHGTPAAYVSLAIDQQRNRPDLAYQVGWAVAGGLGCCQWAGWGPFTAGSSERRISYSCAHTPLLSYMRTPPVRPAAALQDTRPSLGGPGVSQQATLVWWGSTSEGAPSAWNVLGQPGFAPGYAGKPRGRRGD